MNILYTAFKGKTNSSKLLLDLIKTNNKLYLTNSFTTSIKELENAIKDNKYDLIISFGQWKICDYNTLRIETTAAIANDKYLTTYNYDNIVNILKSNNYDALISNDAGDYLCNSNYYYGLKYIVENNLKTKMIFIHIPKINKIGNINELAEIFNNIK